MKKLTLMFGLLIVAFASAAELENSSSAASGQPTNAYFTQCSAPCPVGYHMGCRPCNFVACRGGCPNQTVCAPDSGNLFTQCAAPCPAGYHMGGQSCNLVACSGNCPNQTVCIRN